MINALILAGKVKNPLDGVTPNPGVFGAGINSVLVLILGGVWGIVLIIEIIYALLGLLKWASARKQGHAEEVTEGMQHFKRALVVFGCTVGLPVIVAAVIYLVNQAS